MAQHFSGESRCTYKGWKAFFTRVKIVMLIQSPQSGTRLDTEWYEKK